MERFIVLIFPTEKEKAPLAALAQRFATALEEACSEPPFFIWPDQTKFALLVRGDIETISKALKDAAAIDTRYLVAQVGAPHANAGLVRAAQWLDRQT